MFELSFGELFVVAFVTIAVVSAPWWPKLGAAIAEVLVAPKPAGDKTAPKPGSGSNRDASGESTRG